MVWLIWVQLLYETFCLPTGTVCLPAHLGTPAALEQSYLSRQDCEDARAIRLPDTAPVVVEGIDPEARILIRITTTTWCALDEATS